MKRPSPHRFCRELPEWLLQLRSQRLWTRGALAMLFLIGPLVVTLPRSSRADGINLYWNDCASGLRARTNRVFACDTNIADHFLVASYVYVSDNQNLGRIELFIDIQSAAPVLPPWWGLARTGACRSSALAAISPSNFGTCLDAWGGANAAPEYNYLTTANSPTMPPNRARIYSGSSTDHATIVPLYYEEAVAGLFRIKSIRTVGTGACGGCLDPVCLVLNSITLSCFWDDCPPITLTSPLTSNYVTWQGGAIGGPGCPGATPTLNRTWGQLKTLYR